jgi:hypothetical protein
MSTEKYLPNHSKQSLDHVVEEAGECIEAMGRLIAAAGKAQRFGWDSSNPELPEEQRETNYEWVLREMADVEKAITRFKALTAPKEQKKK